MRFLFEITRKDATWTETIREGVIICSLEEMLQASV
jgi:hypothetical protein